MEAILVSDASLLCAASGGGLVPRAKGEAARAGNSRKGQLVPKERVSGWTDGWAAVGIDGMRWEEMGGEERMDNKEWRMDMLLGNGGIAINVVLVRRLSLPSRGRLSVCLPRYSRVHGEPWSRAEWTPFSHLFLCYISVCTNSTNSTITDSRIYGFTAAQCEGRGHVSPGCYITYMYPWLFYVEF